MAPVGRHTAGTFVLTTSLVLAIAAPAAADPAKPPSPAPAPPATMTVLGVTMARHDPILAMSASLALTGAGQAYNDEWWKAGLFFAGNTLYIAGYVTDFLIGQTAFRWVGLGLLFACKGWSAWDAYRVCATTPWPATPPAHAWGPSPFVPVAVGQPQPWNLDGDQPLMTWAWRF